MIKEYEGRIKVKNSIMALPLNERKAPDLIIGKPYFISFGTNNAYLCKLLKIINEFGYPEVEVEVKIKPRYGKNYLNPGYKLTSKTHLVRATSIGATAEEAVKNCV